MRIELPREAERFGANQFYGVQKVYEVESGLCGRDAHANGGASLIQCVPYERIYEVQRRMAVVVPVRGERIKLIEGVLFGIPHQCLTIVVSNSSRSPVDRFRMEERAVRQYAQLTDREIVIVHQKDPVLGRALAEAGYGDVLDRRGVLRDGKGEGMLLATLIARLAGKDYVGFVDSDNFFPGAVHEYIREYAAGFALSGSPYAMIRILWHSKPKVSESQVVFAKWGRTSVVTNRFVNRLVGYYTGFETDVIKTANAGEHALTMELALRLPFSHGYSVETNHFVALLEYFGGIRRSPFPEVMQEHVDIFQIESRNPHFHEAKGGDHVADMIGSSLSVIYHSPICPEPLKAEILRELRSRRVLGPGEEPPRVPTYPPLRKVDLDRVRRALRGRPCAEILA